MVLPSSLSMRRFRRSICFCFFDGEPLDSSIMSVIWVLMTNSYPFVCYCPFLIKSLVRDFAIDKEYMEYVNWLKKIVVDPETEEVDH